MHKYLIDIAGTCNLKCPSCPVGNFSDSDFLSELKPKGFMDKILFSSIIKRIRDENPGERVLVNLFSWGEPLLHPDLPEFIDELNELGMACNLSSNLNITKNLDKVIKANPYKLRVSLSGFFQENYAISHTKGDVFLLKSNLYKIRYLLNKYKSNTQIEICYHLYSHNVDQDIFFMYQLSEELGFEFSPTWAYLMPVEKALRYYETKSADVFPEISNNMIISPDDAFNITNGIESSDCDLRSRMTQINYDGSVQLCCGTYDPHYVIAKNYLETSTEELRERKYSNPLCGTCMKHNLHKISMYHNAPKWDEVGNERLDEMQAPYKINMFSNPKVSNRQ
ncbi:MAG: hypothetical protein OEM38_05225 [Gammaproteobacteria bacterium]|nr:hypothetical protein [Gammaproteobacteria bacterium]